MSLGTSVDNKPWVCEVHFAFDSELNLYFFSMPSTRHCQEIERNPKVAGAITVQHRMDEKPLGLYFEGMAEKVEAKEENDSGFQAYTGRFPDRADWVTKGYETPDGARLYKIAVADYYMFDARDSKPPQKYHLSWPKS